MLRDHKPVIFDKFNGLWDRDNLEEVPNDHFTDCENIRFVGNTAFATRFGLGTHQSVTVPLGNIVRLYNFVTPTGNTLLALTYVGGVGKIYHVVNSTTIYGPILTKTGMTDFGFVPYAGRAYISPFISVTVGGITIEKGMQNEFLYVYLGDGTAARKAAGTTPAGTVTISNGAAGNTDAGFHLFAVVGETDTGYLSPPVGFNSFTTSASAALNFSTIPIFSGSQWVKRHIVATKIIPIYNGDTQGYIYYFIPNADINDNVVTTLNGVSFFDADLLEDASHLLDNFDQIPAGVGMCLYHNRLILYTTFTDISLVYVSAAGEPEAINKITGLLVVPPDGNPITNASELRDVLYVTKRVRTVSFVDNNDDPTSWPLTIVDNAIGCGVHGIGTVIDSGASSVDFLLIASYQGIMIFNGRYSQPELSWKIKGFWNELDRTNWRLVQLLNDPVNQTIYCTLPDYRLLIGDYANGMDPKNIRWAPWRFDIRINTIALVNINDLILGGESRL